jgi:hypothetical protein
VRSERATFYVRVGPGLEWHVEGPNVDVMLCGVEIGTDGGEVRTKRPLRVCLTCSKKEDDMRRAERATWS